MKKFFRKNYRFVEFIGSVFSVIIVAGLIIAGAIYFSGKKESSPMPAISVSKMSTPSVLPGIQPSLERKLCSNDKYQTYFKSFPGGNLIALNPKTKVKVDYFDLNDIADLTCLEYLQIGTDAQSEHKITTLEPLKNLKNLKYLVIYAIQIDDISPLSGLTNLEILKFQSFPGGCCSASWRENECRIGLKFTDFSPLSNLKKLKILHLDGLLFNDLAVVEGLSELSELSFDCTGVTSLTSLSGLKNLKSISMNWTFVDDLVPLCPLTELHSVSVKAQMKCCDCMAFRKHLTQDLKVGITGGIGSALACGNVWDPEKTPCSECNGGMNVENACK